MENTMAAKTTTDTDIADEDLEPLADETASQAQRVVAAYATDADECRMLLSMLGIDPTAKVD
ncbi:hypothetical protein CH289_05065 [Rhodococcus sp. RS1C4]|nr:hypothetical protein CH289_05065 [Rhodococcus sp. RS1C4]OZC60108.1 hypothetical protein CH267_03935 [Rhodococcus sp. 06-621-2]OZC86144.1 hypothetical protein CH282_11875 [Rhodococcus sp. 06-418-1B]OZD11411.1 hypothetical protein CH253_28940 [Rhodococcus sp. 06-156-3C]OZD13647.1 hypothetical protein CH248_26445 [Rhodococcus sp. 06-156-4a]OZD22012.1 hypothetical protein CH280_00160 [Rhodococcus sp. 06-156-4C]OZD30270.1 hypothetical protein CH284_25025 [Rhodococcus sp. 06-156-3]OZD37677.1 hy